MQISCIKCKGRGYCGRSFCPIIAKHNAMFKVKDVTADFDGGAPSVFVGRVGYPYLNVGILTPPGVSESSEYDAPRLWAEKGFDIKSIVDLRSALVNSRFKIGVMEKSKFLEMSQEIGMASKPVDVEVNLKDKPSIRMDTSPNVTPMGPAGSLEKAKITSNPHIDTRVDKVVSDTDLKANDAIRYLYSKEFDENFLSKVLSIGNLGVKTSRKLVPTRWSITAVDDNLGKMIIEEIKDYNQMDYTAYFGDYLGNYYLILCFPEPWSYELFETYMPEASWNISFELQYSTDYEPYTGRKTYAENCAGGYYSVRLAVLEKLRRVKKQASVLVLRFITGEYAVPLGVWVTREAARKAMESRGLEFASRELMLKYAWALIKKKFGFDVNEILQSSIMLKDIKSQSKLKQFF
ncbi:hypothetical protein KY337_02775 [Candidatus Woesearchaeota archaeon]|nr:hypothetical protein [Candidatus Woesearchaeota archaeon]